MVSPWGGTESGAVEQALCQKDGNVLICPVSLVEAPLAAPRPVVISLLEGGEEPWIPDVRSPEAVPGDLSPGEVVEGRGLGQEEPSLCFILGTVCYFWISSFIQQELGLQIYWRISRKVV